jgi:hypothetical protein
LDDRDFIAVSEGSEHHSQRGGGFAFARSGIDDYQAFFVDRFLDPLGLYLLPTLHFLFVLVVSEVGHLEIRE